MLAAGEIKVVDIAAKALANLLCAETEVCERVAVGTVAEVGFFLDTLRYGGALCARFL
jgi:hypothetical protein